MRTHLVSRVFCGWRAEVSEVGTDPGVWTWRPNSAPGTGGWACAQGLKSPHHPTV